MQSIDSSTNPVKISFKINVSSSVGLGITVKMFTLTPEKLPTKLLLENNTPVINILFEETPDTDYRKRISNNDNNNNEVCAEDRCKRVKVSGISEQPQSLYKKKRSLIKKNDH